jgi:cytoskeletal protein CcmA (bactofilin family)
MWKKDDKPVPAPTAPQPKEKTPRPESTRLGADTGERATIGRSITIRGDVSGDEDLLIQGRVDGSVDLKQRSVTVGQEGRVKANITGRVVIVEGEVEGDLRAEEQVILRSTARVQGDITASRVVLEDGASFRGGVDMGDPSERSKRTADPLPAQAKKTPIPTKAPPEPGKDAPDTADKATT